METNRYEVNNDEIYSKIIACIESIASGVEEGVKNYNYRKI